MTQANELQITYVYMWGQLDLCGEEFQPTIEDKKFLNSNSDYTLQNLIIQSPVVLSTFELKRIISVCCTNDFTLALTEYGQTWLWGKDQLSQPVEGLQNVFVKKIAATTPGGNFSYFSAIDRKGDLYQWVASATPQKITLPAPVESVALGEGDVVALTADSQVYTWQLRGVTFDPQGIFPLTALSPAQIGGAKVVQIANSYFGAALTSDHSLYTWGISRGPSGGNFLGHGPKFSGMNQGPKLVEALKNRVAYFACGFIHMMAVTLDDEVYGWGDGDTNRLGHGLPREERHRDSPTLIPELCGKKVKKLSLARGNECALTESGEVYLWGGLDFGGHHDHTIPTLLEMDTLFMQEAKVMDISSGRSHTALVTTVAMTLKHLCFRVIAFNLTKFANLQNALPPELREALACFLADRRRLNSKRLKILGLDNNFISERPGKISRRMQRWDM
eukprot:Phypoly_transcript_07698.p1 GENE.Phypoly_transcript_07698~~Phypoly_transcript_07698.p1  ORF type:complete len:469 (+),score=51.44 Phypoly_transcript_07698:68-1408(+)